ncbi:MAG: HAMP domain-containing sensor histidine kinase [Chloroflexota bacterium]
MRSLRSQLILSHVLPFVLVLPLVGLVLLYLLEAQILLADLSSDLEERAALIAEAIDNRPEVFSNPQEAQQFVAEVSILVDGDIYLLDPTGQVLAASPNLAETPVPSEVVQEIRLVTTGEPSVTIDYGITDQEGEALVPVTDINQQLMGIVGVHETLQGVAGSFTHVRSLVLLTLLGGVLLGALIGMYLAQRLEAPIAEAADAVHDIATGQPVQHISPRGPAEIQELSESVNVLSERLRLLEQTRRRSLANIVHELGRPLGAILAAVHVLRETPGEDPEVRAELLAGVEQELEHMEPILDDLSTLHSEVTGQQRLDLKPVNLSEWLMATLLPWRAVALEQDLEWSADIPNDLPQLSIDPDRMAQVVGNLVSNAVKYTPAGENVRVTAVANAVEVRIAVSDTGPGIAPEEQSLIFEPFYRSRHPQRFSEGLDWAPVHCPQSGGCPWRPSGTGE